MEACKSQVTNRVALNAFLILGYSQPRLRDGTSVLVPNLTLARDALVFLDPFLKVLETTLFFLEDLRDTTTFLPDWLMSMVRLLARPEALKEFWLVRLPFSPEKTTPLTPRLRKALLFCL